MELGFFPVLNIYLTSGIVNSCSKYIKLDITPNRGDCFSVYGIARELAVINNLNLKHPKFESIESSFKEDLRVKVCKEAPIYVGRSIKNINLKTKTLPLVAERLALSDQKLIDPVVDITNYILLELGQPLHAFDRDKLEGNINVRKAKETENLVLLDDQEIWKYENFEAINIIILR